MLIFALMLLTLGVTGYLLLRALSGSWAIRLPGFCFLSLAAGTTIGAWLALSLAELGIYSFGLWWIITLLLAILLAAVGRKRSWLVLKDPEAIPAQTLPWNQRSIPRQLEYFGLGFWLLVASFLYLRPHETILGFNDAGVYLHLGASIAENGQISWQDPFLAQLPTELHGAFYRELDETFAFAPYYLMPAFYVTNADAGLIVPQFFHLHSAWLALAHNSGGPPLMLLMTGFWGLMAAGAIYLTVRQLFGWETALVVLWALAVSALQVWFARYPTTEMLTQFLLWSGVFCLIRWDADEVPNFSWGMLVGLFWGALFLTRIDAYFVLAIPAILLSWRWLNGRLRRTDWGLVIVLGLLTAQSMAHGLLISPVYFRGLFQYAIWQVQFNPLPFATLTLLGLVGLAISSRFRRQIIASQRWSPMAKIAASSIVVILTLYNYFVRPVRPQAVTEVANWVSAGTVPILDHENLLRLGWYLAPAGIFLAAAGLIWLIWSWRRSYLPIIGVGLIFTILYIWQIQANPHQIYAMRRYVPAVLPFVMIAAGTGLMALYRQQGIGRWLGLLLLTVWFSGLLWSGRGFLSQIDHRGLVADFAEFNALLEPESILLFANPADSVINPGDTLGGPLRFFHGHDVLLLRQRTAYAESDLIAQIESWLAVGRSVYWIGPLPASYNELAIEAAFNHTISSQSLERSYDHKPTLIVDERWEFAVQQFGMGNGATE